MMTTGGSISTARSRKASALSLLQVARLRARVAKDQVVAFAAKLKADFEKQLDAHYPWDSGQDMDRR